MSAVVYTDWSKYKLSTLSVQTIAKLSDKIKILLKNNTFNMFSLFLIHQW